MKKNKGNGVKTSNQLTAEQKIKLTLWADRKGPSCNDEPYEELAIQAEKELGFKVVLSNVQTVCTAMYGKRHERKPKKASEIERLEAMIFDLAEKVVQLEMMQGMHECTREWLAPIHKKLTD